MKLCCIFRSISCHQHAQDPAAPMPLYVDVVIVNVISARDVGVPGLD